MATNNLARARALSPKESPTRLMVASHSVATPSQGFFAGLPRTAITGPYFFKLCLRQQPPRLRCADVANRSASSFEAKPIPRRAGMMRRQTLRASGERDLGLLGSPSDLARRRGIVADPAFRCDNAAGRRPGAQGGTGRGTGPPLGGHRSGRRVRIAARAGLPGATRNFARSASGYSRRDRDRWTPTLPKSRSW